MYMYVVISRLSFHGCFDSIFVHVIHVHVHVHVCARAHTHAHTHTHMHTHTQHSRAAPSLSDDERGNASASICSASAIISERVNSTRTYCSLLCIYETLYNYNTTDPDSKPEPLLGVVWPSWLGLSTQVDTDGIYNGTVCRMYSFKFEYVSCF